MFKSHCSCYVIICFASILLSVHAQNAEQLSTSNPPVQQSAIASSSLTSDEKIQADVAQRDFATGKYGDALAIYKSLVAAHPTELVLSKFAAEAAINTGNRDYALGLLKTIESNDPNDWQAAALLARAYAESGDKQNRTAEMARMEDLYKRGIIPARMQQYLLESIMIGDKTMRIWHSLQPWGKQKVYDYARVFDSKGQLLLRMELESMDIDQALFAKEHPDEAAKGVRMFSFDMYTQSQANANGTQNITHATVDMFVGQPSYDTTRKAFLEIAGGKYSPQETSILKAKAH